MPASCCRRGAVDILYRRELDALGGVAVSYTLTRRRPEGWGGFDRRVDADMLAAVGPAAGERPRIFVCGPTAFVEAVADLLLALGHDRRAIRTERFGPTGG
jgi:ferredoxin-NADP reductase